MSSLPQNRQLPSKESALFKQILKLYEFKQYKKGYKTCDMILKKFPNHGETLAMKGLFASNLNKKDQALDLIKQGVRNDLTSHICWHVMGLYHRSTKNYDEAIKCYSNALRHDKENLQIQRDLSLLQIQLRDYQGFNDTINQLLVGRSNQKIWWLSYAISNHLLGEYQLAEQVINAYLGTLKEIKVDYDVSELYLYRNMIIKESGDLERCLVDLYEIKDKVVDRLGWLESLGEVLEKLGKTQEAKKVYLELYGSNVENQGYLERLVAVDGRRESEIYKELSQEYSRSNLLARLPLKVLKGDEFEKVAKDWLIKQFVKGIPSVFVVMKDVYVTQPWSMEVVGNLVRGFKESIEEDGKFDNGIMTSPTTWLWITSFLSQHEDYLGNSIKALEYIDEALNHTPTLVELYMIKARILKHSGQFSKAAEVMNMGREIDLQDRFINSKSVKYWLRSGNVDKAKDVICMFTKPDTKDPLADLIEMQNMWWTIELAMALFKKGDGKEAFDKLKEIVTHFQDIYEDQFDFHSYALRKSTLRNYIQLLRFEDGLYSHEYFVRAAKIALGEYLKDLRKGGDGKGVDDFVGPLGKYSQDVESQNLVLEVYSLKGKVVLAMKAFKKANSIGSKSRFFELLTKTDNLNDKVLEIVKEELEKIESGYPKTREEIVKWLDGKDDSVKDILDGYPHWKHFGIGDKKDKVLKVFDKAGLKDWLKLCQIDDSWKVEAKKKFPNAEF